MFLSPALPSPELQAHRSKCWLTSPGLLKVQSGPPTRWLKHRVSNATNPTSPWPLKCSPSANPTATSSEIPHSSTPWNLLGQPHSTPQLPTRVELGPFRNANHYLTPGLETHQLVQSALRIHPKSSPGGRRWPGGLSALSPHPATPTLHLQAA